MAISEAYTNYTMQQERIRLYPEDGQKVPTGRCILRALNWFVFMRDGHHVAPLYERCTPDYWKGVRAYGFIASLSGEARWHIMGGFWDFTWGGREMALVCIDQLYGLSKESSPHWRGGETALWLETKLGYSYALLDPAEEYLSVWTPVVKSWIPVGDGEDPTYHDVKPNKAQPAWWKGARAWTFMREELYGARRVDKNEESKPKASSSKRTLPAPEASKKGSKKPTTSRSQVRDYVEIEDSDEEDEGQAPPVSKRRKRDAAKADAPGSSRNVSSLPAQTAAVKHESASKIPQKRPKPIVIRGDTESEGDPGADKSPPDASAPTASEIPTAAAPATGGAELIEDLNPGTQESAGMISLRDAIDGMGV
ncbi:hypothetical protein V565_230630, partial [Rhizoctonia solani 123E]